MIASLELKILKFLVDGPLTKREIRDKLPGPVGRRTAKIIENDIRLALNSLAEYELASFNSSTEAWNYCGPTKPLETVQHDDETPLACPFCGKSTKILMEEIDTNIFMGICDHCGTCGPSGQTRQDAIKQWNKRAILSDISPHPTDQEITN